MTSQDYFRPRGDITTVLDLTDRDAQDHAYFPLDAEATFFHRGSLNRSHALSPSPNESEKGTDGTDRPATVHPTTLSYQEFPQRGPAQWGQMLTFELGSLPAGDLLQGIALQVQLGSWYNDTILAGLAQNTLTASVQAVSPVGGGAPPAASVATTTSVLLQTPAVPQLLSTVSTNTLVAWDQVDTVNSIGITDASGTSLIGLTYAAGLFTNSTVSSMTVLVNVALYLDQPANGSTFVGINMGQAVYQVLSVTAAWETTQVMYSATVTLQPNDVLGIYYMDNDVQTILPTSVLSLTIETVGAAVYPLPVPTVTPTLVSTASIDYSSQYWTYVNGLGTSLIEYADFIVKDQTIERLTGEFIRTYFHTVGIGSLFGLSTDALGEVPYPYLSPSVVSSTPFSPSFAYPIEGGTYFCVLPFFFYRTKLAEVFPLLSCQEGQVRIDIKLRPFEEMVRRYVGWRANPTDSPLNQTVPFVVTPVTSALQQAQQVQLLLTPTATNPPAFRDFRMVTACSYTTGILRDRLLRQPFEQMVKLVQTFSFDEPLKYAVNKTEKDVIEIQLPLELNHPVVELLWVFRRKAVRINHEWTNFAPSVGYETTPDTLYPPWLQYATLRVNGSDVIAAEGDWFRRHSAEHHAGGWNQYQSHVYGYSFAERPDLHQPTGTANMSRATSVMLQLRVNPPMAAPLPAGCVFDSTVVNGWEVMVFGLHYNWLRFQNGICNLLFS